MEALRIIGGLRIVGSEHAASECAVGSGDANATKVPSRVLADNVGASNNEQSWHLFRGQFFGDGNHSNFAGLQQREEVCKFHENFLISRVLRGWFGW